MEKGPAPYVAEFLGTFVLVFTIGCNVLSKQTLWAGVSIGCSLMVMIYALAPCSGANFNPAVSLSLGIANKLDWPEVAKYIVAQIVGGICAGLAYTFLFDESFNLAPTLGHSMWKAGVAEMFYTCMLCFVVLNTAASKRHANKNQFYGIAIGFVVVAGAYGAGAISGGCFNPAVALGIDVSSAHIGFGYGAIYTLWEFAGAGLATGLFYIVRPEEIPSEVENSTAPVVYEMRPRLISEFVGTYMLVLTVGLNVLSRSPAAAFSIAASLISMIFALGSCSGAHFNPAVTISILVSGRDKISFSDAIGYIVFQIAGGMAASGTFCWLKNGHSFAIKPEGSPWSRVAVAELMFTFVLCFVVLSVASTKENRLNEYFGLAIGMCVAVGGNAIGKISGGSLNPAVSIGVGISHMANGGEIASPLGYSAIECVAGVAAAVTFKVLFRSEYEGDDDKNV